MILQNSLSFPSFVLVPIRTPLLLNIAKILALSMHAIFFPSEYFLSPAWLTVYSTIYTSNTLIHPILFDEAHSQRVGDLYEHPSSLQLRYLPPLDWDGSAGVQVSATMLASGGGFARIAVDNKQV